MFVEKQSNIFWKYSDNDSINIAVVDNYFDALGLLRKNNPALDWSFRGSRYRKIQSFLIGKLVPVGAYKMETVIIPSIFDYDYTFPFALWLNLPTSRSINLPFIMKPASEFIRTAFTRITNDEIIYTC